MQIRKIQILADKKILLKLGDTEVAVASEKDADMLVKAYLTIAPYLNLSQSIRSITMEKALCFEPVMEEYDNCDEDDEDDEEDNEY